MFETAECQEVWNSIFLVQRYEKHENQMKGFATELKVSDWQISAWTLWACDSACKRLVTGEVQQITGPVTVCMYELN